MSLKEYDTKGFREGPVSEVITTQKQGPAFYPQHPCKGQVWPCPLSSWVVQREPSPGLLNWLHQSSAGSAREPA